MSEMSSSNWSEVDANNTAAAPNGWASGTFPNQVEGIGQATMGALKRWWDRMNGTVTSTGSSNAYVYTPSNVSYPASIVTGEEFTFKANFTNTSAATLAINGLTAKSIFKQTTSGPAALSGGEIQSGQLVKVQYDGTQYQIISAIPAATSATVTAFRATNSSGFAATTKMTGWTEIFDTTGNFEPTTNGRFTASVTGTYLFAWHAVQNGSPSDLLKVTLYKNGVSLSITALASATQFDGCSATACIELASTDYVELYVTLGTSGSDAAVTWFTGYLIG